jgi:hypothetical protein
VAATGDRRSSAKTPLDWSRSVPGGPLFDVVSGPERLFEWWFDRFSARVHQRARQRAWTDPEWVAIERRRDLPGAGRALRLSTPELPWDDLLRQAEIIRSIRERIAARWPYRVKRFLEDHGPTRCYLDCVAFLQRGRRGFADRDLWGLDHFLDGVLAGVLREMAGTVQHGPVDPDGLDTRADYRSHLLTLAARFDLMASEDWWYPELDGRIRPRPTEETQPFVDETFAMLSRLWMALWD